MVLTKFDPGKCIYVVYHVADGMVMDIFDESNKAEALIEMSGNATAYAIAIYQLGKRI